VCEGGTPLCQHAAECPLFRERGPRSAPREPLTSAREGTLEVFSFLSVSKIWPELAACFRREIAIGSDAISKFGPAFCPDTRGQARRRRQARSAHAIEAERGARRPRWRPPEAARDLRPHGVWRRRLQRTLRFAEAVLLRRVSPSPLRPHPFDRAKPNRFRSQRNRLLSSPSASVDVGPRPPASHMPVASSPSLLLAPQAWPALLLPGRSLFALSHRPPSRLHTALHHFSAPLLTTAGALAARCVQLRWR